MWPTGGQAKGAPLTRIEAALSNAIAAVGEEGFRVALIGGLAVSARSEPRFTRDVDLAVAVDSDADAEKLVARLLARGYRVLAQIEQEQTGRLATVRLSPPGEHASGLVVDLLFASSGIEPELVQAAEALQLSAAVAVPVAKLEHLLALKVLSRDDDTRPQDRADIVSLLAEANPSDLAGCRRALSLITERGYARGRLLLASLEELTGPRGEKET